MSREERARAARTIVVVIPSFLIGVPIGPPKSHNHCAEEPLLEGMSCRRATEGRQL